MVARMLLAVMLVTAFFSLWLPNNESAAIMMLPITVLIIKEFAKVDKSFSLDCLSEANGNGPAGVANGMALKAAEQHCKCKQFSSANGKSKALASASSSSENASNTRAGKSDVDEMDDDEHVALNKIRLTTATMTSSGSGESDEEKGACGKDKASSRRSSTEGSDLVKCFSLGVGYAAIIGGNCSLIGGTTNILLKGFFDEKYPRDRLNFVTFMMFALPVSALVMLLTWVVLCYKWLPKRYWFTLAKRKTTRVSSDDEQEKGTAAADQQQTPYDKLTSKTSEPLT